MCTADRRATFLRRARQILGEIHVLQDDVTRYARDWRGKYVGSPLAVVLPASTGEVASIISLCAEFGVPVVPQGGNTSQCGGAVPDESGTQIVLSLARMNKVLAVDASNNTMTVQAGCVLQNLQDVARQADRLFPLALGAQGTCQIGGNISTNAGGVQVIRYGNTRELVLGLEVVLPTGNVLDLQRGLRKDNTGYDLKQLFIGAEGTLGVVTAATLKLFPAPRSTCIAWVALKSVHAAVELLSSMRLQLGERLTAFELLSAASVEIIRKHFPDSPKPLTGEYPWFVLLQADGSESEQVLVPLVEESLHAALANCLLEDVAIARSVAQGDALWLMRENISEAQQREGPNIKHDVSIPISAIAGFVGDLEALVAEHYPGGRCVVFGHVGDGNLHVNVFGPPHLATPVWHDHTESVNALVHDLTARCAGSISAEHGVGQMKREELTRYKAAEELEVMRSIKKALDPLHLMNPGKVISIASHEH